MSNIALTATASVSATPLNSYLYLTSTDTLANDDIIEQVVGANAIIGGHNTSYGTGRVTGTFYMTVDLDLGSSQTFNRMDFHAMPFVRNYNYNVYDNSYTEAVFKYHFYKYTDSWVFIETIQQDVEIIQTAGENASDARAFTSEGEHTASKVRVVIEMPYKLDGSGFYKDLFSLTVAEFKVWENLADYTNVLQGDTLVDAISASSYWSPTGNIGNITSGFTDTGYGYGMLWNYTTTPYSGEFDYIVYKDFGTTYNVTRFEAPVRFGVESLYVTGVIASPTATFIVRFQYWDGTEWLNAYNTTVVLSIWDDDLDEAGTQVFEQTVSADVDINTTKVRIVVEMDWSCTADFWANLVTFSCLAYEFRAFSTSQTEFGFLNIHSQIVACDLLDGGISIYDGTQVYNVPLVATSASDASAIRIYDGTTIKALKAF